MIGSTSKIIPSRLPRVVPGLWSFVVVLKCVGEVQGFSAWRALGAMFLAGLLIVVPLILFVVLILAARG